jgi:RecB family exonuclease
MIIKGKLLKAAPDKQKSNLFALSVSKAKTFKTCKAKYRFQYIEHLPKKEWEFQIFGSFLHEVLENFHQYIIDGSKDPDNIVMSKAYKAALEIWGKKLTSDQKKQCFEILKGYLTIRNKSQNNLPEVIAVEKPFNIELDGQILLNGFIDVVQIDSDGILHVSDYKTSKHKKYLKNDFMQLKTYAYSLFLEDPSLDIIRCSYIMLKFNFDTIDVEFTREEAMEMEKEFAEYSELINKERLFRASPGPLCNYCDFLGSCQEGMDKTGVGKVKFGEMDW